MRKIGYIIIELLAFILALVGAVSLYNAYAIPQQYSLFNASAIQITQVYSEASHSALFAIGCFVAAAFLELTLSRAEQKKTQEALLIIRKAVGAIGQIVSKR
jgi:hypothetical protein